MAKKNKEAVATAPDEQPKEPTGAFTRGEQAKLVASFQVYGGRTVRIMNVNTDGTFDVEGDVSQVPWMPRIPGDQLEKAGK
jgi:hypothetical protein